MIPEIAFQGLLVSDDPSVLSTMDPILRSFLISPQICPQSGRTGGWLDKTRADLVVVDLEAVHASEVLRRLQESKPEQQPTILAVSSMDGALPGVHIVLPKPVTRETGFRSVQVAYSKMLHDFRKHSRFALLQQVLVTDENEQNFTATLINIGAGGIGLKSGETLEIGDILSFRFRLPELESEITLRVRVRWTKADGAAGCEYVYVPCQDAPLLHAWLESHYRIEKPSLTVD
jgi:hypothetical protein